MSLKVTKTDLEGVLILEPEIYEDDRGFFYESFNAKSFLEATNFNAIFLQDNHSQSNKGVLRGLHYQTHQAQGKLVRVIEGCVYDVCVDIRKGSQSFGKWVSIELSAENKKQLWIPPNFAHGFLTLSDTAQVLYKTTNFYNPKFEKSIRWDDPSINIKWPIMNNPPSLSEKDINACLINEAKLPQY